MTAAEESTSLPGVSRPVYLGGLGFTYKWNMGWMHDILQYMKEDPVHRRWHHNLVTFSALYMHSENFILPFSHDEVVHGKRSMIDKMPGDAWQKYAKLRVLYGYMYGHPGKKLLFMGGEFAQWREWNHDRSLDWHLLDDPAHAGDPPLRPGSQSPLPARAGRCTRRDFDPAGFRWIDCNDIENSVISLVRYAKDHAEHVVMVCQLHAGAADGLPHRRPRRRALRRAAQQRRVVYGGGNVGNQGGIRYRIVRGARLRSVAELDRPAARLSAAQDERCHPMSFAVLPHAERAFCTAIDDLAPRAAAVSAGVSDRCRRCAVGG